MKTKILFAAVVMAFISMAATPVPTSTNCINSIKKSANGFDFIRSHRQGRGATITWAFSTPGATAFALQRTYEDPNDPYSVWEAVTSIPSNNSRSYKHTDENCFPGTINYRVVALMSDGTTTMSDITSIRI